MKVSATTMIALMALLLGTANTAMVSFGLPSASGAGCPDPCICTKTEMLCSGANITEVLGHGIDFQVQYLDLSNTSMAILPLEISSISACKTLNLSMNRIQEIDKFALQHLWDLENLTLSNNSITDMRSINPNFLIYSNKNIKVLDLSNNPLQYFGRDLDSMLYSESLEILDISGCRIATLKGPLVLGGLKKLLYLNLSNNPLTVIDGLFSSSLQTLSARGCQLSYLDGAVLNGLTNLQLFDVSLNDQLNLGNDIHSTELASVDLSMCSIREPNLQGMEKLKSAFLNGNRIRNLEAYQFVNNTMLCTLDLSGNHVSFIHPLAFYGMSSLIFLDLSMNKISRIAWDVTFVGLHSLQSLNLSQNSVSSFSNLMSDSLRQLDLSHCRIKSLPNATLAQLDQLTELFLSNNPLQSLNPGSLSSTQLALLDLSYCRISHLSNLNEFANSPNLFELRLTGNRLVTLRNGTFNRCPRLKYVYLDDNPWRCDCYSANFVYMASIANFTSRLQSVDRYPRCLTPDNVTGMPWFVACANGPAYGRDNRKNFSMAVGVILILCVSGLMAICVAVHENVKTRQAMRRRRQLDGEFGDADRRAGHGGAGRAGGGGADYYDEYAAAAESLRKLSQLPSYDEAIMLPKPAEPLRLIKRHSCTQTDDASDDPLTEVAMASTAEAEATADEAATWPLQGERFLSPPGFRVTRL